MSTPVIYLIGDAAQAIGDPNKQRITLDQWVAIFNRSQRELCQKANLLKYQDCFDLIADQQIYDYPESMVVMTGVEVTETPGDDASWRHLDEMFEDEFRNRTYTRYPDATLPRYYFSTSAWYHLIPAATDTILQGGSVTYYSLPERVTADEVTGGKVIEVPDFAQDYVLRRMIIHGKMSRNRVAEASADLQLWEADMGTLQDKLDDRSQDRRSTIAPRANRFKGMR